MKKCFKCNIKKSLKDFYAHPEMPDGHVNKCKKCNKKDVASHRIKNIDKIRAYDRDRGLRQPKEYFKNYNKKYPNAHLAITKVNNFVRDGKLKKKKCEICNSVKVVAHHDDYLKPLEVRWMCQAHHKQWHVKNGEGLNKR